jgi:hypothetical protein
MHDKTKKKYFYLLASCLTLVIFLCSLEIASYFIIIVKKANFYLPLNLDRADTTAVKERFAKTFSHDLGWEPNRPENMGYRGTYQDAENAKICLFGDSYTYGHSDIEKSWAYLLEKKVNKPVLNFGVQAYGTDQAYWRFEKRYGGKIKCSYVCLAVMSENIARTVNRYRGFYFRKETISATKPMYYKEQDGDIVLLPNPLKNANEIEYLSDMDFLKKIGKKDYWYNHFENYNLNQKIHFPYSFFLIKALPYYMQSYYKKRIQQDDDYKILYRDDSALSIMEHIILKFIKSAKEKDTFPIILFLPNWKDLLDHQKNRETIYHTFFLSIKNKSNASFDALEYFIPYLEKGDGVSTFFNSYDDGHYNPHGEKILSEGFYQDLQTLERKNNFIRLNSEDINNNIRN